MTALVDSAFARAQREAALPRKRRSKAALASLEHLRGLATDIPKEVSGLDGPLSHLLARRHECQRKLEQAELNLDNFLAAAQWLIDRAGEKTVAPVEALPGEVRRWLHEIKLRAQGAAEKDSRQVQRAD